MILLLPQIFMFGAAWLWFNHLKLSTEYYLILLLSFTITGLIWLPGFTTQIIPLHIFFLVLMGSKVVTASLHINRRSLIAALLMLLPFILSIFWNTFFFETIISWEFNGENREGYSKFTERTGLDTTNFTQLIYLVFALTLYVVYSSLQLDRDKLKKMFDITFYTVAAVCVFQVLAWEGRFYHWYETLVYTRVLHVDAYWGLHQQMIFESYKRLNAGFAEPSYLAYFLFFTVLTYLLIFGYEASLKSKAFWVGVVTGILSTSTTFYWGGFLLIILCYLRYSTEDQKMYYYIIALILLPILAFYLWSFIAYYAEIKTASTDERWLVSWVYGWTNFSKSPFFGSALGSDRPLFIYTMLLGSVGIVGTLLFLFGLSFVKSSTQVTTYLAIVFIFGCGIFELQKPEMWLYLGLLSNPSVMTANAKKELKRKKVSLRRRVRQSPPSRQTRR